MGDINHAYYTGLNAVAVIDFNATGEAASSVTIGGVVYQEADIADPPNGVWTNGASAANSATSLAAAINGDTRGTKPAISAVVSDVGDSVVIAYDRPGVDGNLAVSKVSASAITIENLHSGDDGGRKRIAVANYVITAQDVLADEVNIPVAFVPTGFVVNVRTTAGVIKAATVEATIQAAPNRIRLNFAGATDPIAGDIVHLISFE